MNLSLSWFNLLLFFIVFEIIMNRSNFLKFILDILQLEYRKTTIIISLCWLYHNFTIFASSSSVFCEETGISVFRLSPPLTKMNLLCSFQIRDFSFIAQFLWLDLMHSSRSGEVTLNTILVVWQRESLSQVPKTAADFILGVLLQSLEYWGIQWDANVSILSRFWHYCKECTAGDNPRWHI